MSIVIKKFCGDCDVELEVRVSKFTQKKLSKPYYFTHTLRCPRCNKLYLDEKYKVENRTFGYAEKQIMSQLRYFN